jgi:hypothetical protein
VRANIKRLLECDFLLCDQLSSLSSRKFIRDEIATLRWLTKLSGIYSVRQRQQFYALQIPAQETAGMTGFYFLIN